MLDRIQNLAFGLTFSLIAVPAFAHPGHGSVPAENPVHYFVEPIHAAVLAGVLVVILGLRVFAKKTEIFKFAKQIDRKNSAHD